MAQKGRCAALIKQIDSELEKNANNYLREDDLTLSQISALLELDKAEGQQMEIKQMEHLLHLAQSTTFGIVQRLEQKGYVETFESPRHKRIKVIRITPAGQECCRKAQVQIERTEEQLTSVLTEAEKTILITLLQKLRDSYD